MTDSAKLSSWRAAATTVRDKSCIRKANCNGWKWS